MEVRTRITKQGRINKYVEFCKSTLLVCWLLFPAFIYSTHANVKQNDDNVCVKLYTKKEADLGAEELQKDLENSLSSISKLITVAEILKRQLKLYQYNKLVNFSLNSNNDIEHILKLDNNNKSNDFNKCVHLHWQYTFIDVCRSFNSVQLIEIYLSSKPLDDDFIRDNDITLVLFTPFITLNSKTNKQLPKLKR